MNDNQTPAPVPNLRESKREQAAAKKPAPAKLAPKKAAATKPAADKPAAKISWKRAGEPDAKGEADGTGTCGDREYTIKRAADGKFTATVKQGRKTETLAEGVSGKVAWQKCVDHNKGVAA